MPYEITTEDNGSRIITRYYGKLTAAEVYAAYTERFTDIKKINQYKVLLNDYTDVTETVVSDVDVAKLAAIYTAAAMQNPHVIAVSIMPTDLQFGLGRMWEGYIFEIPWEEIIVRTQQEATQWLAKKLGA